MSFRFSSTTCRRRTRALRGTMIGLLGTKTPAASGAARRATSGRRGHRSGVRPRRWTRPRPVGAWGRYRPGNSPGASSSPEMPNRPPGMTRHRNARPPSRGRTRPRPRGRTREATRRLPPETPRLRAMPRRGARGTGAPTPTSRPRPMQNSTTSTAFRAVGTASQIRQSDRVVSPAVGRDPRADEVILSLAAVRSPSPAHDRAHHEPAASHLSGLTPSPVRRRRALAGRTPRDHPRTRVPPRARRLGPSIRGLSRQKRQSSDTPSRGTLRCGSSPALFRTRFLAETSTARASCLKSAST